MGGTPSPLPRRRFGMNRDLGVFEKSNSTSRNRLHRFDRQGKTPCFIALHQNKRPHGRFGFRSRYGTATDRLKWRYDQCARGCATMRSFTAVLHGPKVLSMAARLWIAKALKHAAKK